MKYSKHLFLHISGLRMLLVLAVVTSTLGLWGTGIAQAATCFNLTIIFSPSAGGTVNANPLSDPTCGGSGYTSGTVVTLTATPNSQYILLGWAGTNSAFSNPTTVTMDANKSVTVKFVPKNDAIGNATLITGLTYLDIVNTTEALDDDSFNPPSRGPCTDSDTPTLKEGFKSLWYKYTPPEKQSIQADTFGSVETENSQSLDTYIVIWKKVSVDPAPLSLELVRCNDDTDGVNSRISFLGDQSTTYYFEVAQYNGDVGTSNTYTSKPANMIFNVNITNTSATIGGGQLRNYYIASQGIVADRYGTNGGPVHVFSPTGQNIFTSQRAIYGSSFNSIVGFPANQLTTEYWFTSYDDLGMITYLVIGNPSTTETALVDVYIGGVKKNTTPYSILPGQRVFPRYGINGGPVRVASTNGVNIFASERSKYGSSFNEVLGFPSNQLDTEFWFTSYDDAGMITYLVIGNPSTTETAQVDVYIGGVKQNTTPYSILPGQRVFPRYGINGGPVRVVSTNGVDIFTSERTKYSSSFNEVLGFPLLQASTELWFTSLDDANMITYLVIGNPSTTETAQVDVYIGGVKKNTTPYSILPGQRVYPRYGINGGPVHIVVTNGVKVFASERTKYLSSFNEILGIPFERITTDYWYTSLDDVGMITELVISAP
ncbi:MAG: hypothetical protein IPP66_06930 [Anaerolineales bacterium]|nr:hypothetical protein [Anaerolineales bacterium]